MEHWLIVTNGPIQMEDELPTSTWFLPSYICIGWTHTQITSCAVISQLLKSEATSSKGTKCLEVLPYLSCSTRPNRCALVSPAISSNPATSTVFLVKPQSVMRKTYPIRGQRAHSGARLLWKQGNISLSPATRKRSVPQGGWLPSPLRGVWCTHTVKLRVRVWPSFALICSMIFH